MNYINTFRSLNPHLHTAVPEGRKGDMTVSSIARNPPTILQHKDAVKRVLQANHGFSDLLFDSVHTVSYPAHTALVKKRNGSGFFRIVNAYTLWGEGYYHFLTEVLPSVLFLDKPYTIHCPPSAFAESVFRWFSVPNKIVMAKPTFDNVKESWEQPYIECGNPSPQKLALLRDCIQKKVTFQRKYGILIQRREPVRQIINHAAFLTMLSRVFPSLEWKTFDRLSIDDTAELFSKAAMIVAPHGAGLTNMIFGDAGIPIVECMPLEKPNLCYWHLSELMGNPYWMIPLPTVGGNFTIDIDGVEPLFRHIHSILDRPVANSHFV